MLEIMVSAGLTVLALVLTALLQAKKEHDDEHQLAAEHGNAELHAATDGKL